MSQVWTPLCAVEWRLDLRLIDIYTVDFYTEVSEASCADQSDIAYPYDSNGHNATP